MDNSKLNQQLQVLRDMTKDKKIPWSFINANQVRWVSEIEGKVHTVTLQEVVIPSPMPVKKANYIFNIQVTPPPAIITQINTNTDDKYRALLAEIFSSAIAASLETSADVIEKLLKSRLIK